MNIKDFVEDQKRAGVTKGEFAKLAGLNRAHLSQIISGRRQEISLPTMLKLVEASGGVVSQVIDFVVEPRS